MTCVVALIENGKIYMGSDSAGVSDQNIEIRSDSKIFIKDDKMIFGFSGSFRLGQLLRYKFLIPEHADGIDVYQYMVTYFVDSVRQCFKDGGFLRKDNEVESAGGF